MNIMKNAPWGSMRTDFPLNVMCIIVNIIKWKLSYVTGPLWGESTGDRWIPLIKASDAELWCFLWSAPEQTVEEKIEMQVICGAIALIMTSL